MSDRPVTAEGTLITYQSCVLCRYRWYFARPFCPECGTSYPRAHTAEGTGTVAAVTTIHRTPSPAHQAIVPFSLALIDLAEGVRVMGHVPLDAAIGDQVAGSLQLVAGERVPVFTRAAA